MPVVLMVQGGFSPEELEETFEKSGIGVTGIYGDFAYYLPE